MHLFLNPTTNGLCDVSLVIGGDPDATGVNHLINGLRATGDGVDATGDGVYALGGDAGDVADASPGLSSSVFLHIFRLAKRTARADRPADVSGVVSLEVFNMTVDGIIIRRG
jgi:hypothetical protein